MRLPLATALAFALALLAPVQAEGCYVPTEGSPEVTTPATGVSLTYTTTARHGEYPGIYYIDNDACQPDCLFSVWVYEESNGMPGLQRGDHIYDDYCGVWEPDTIIF